MRQLLFPFIILIMTTAIRETAQAQQLNLSKVKAFEHQLEDVMELLDTTELKIKLQHAEENYTQNSNEINKVRLGIIYHEAALNLSFLSETLFKGYAKRSFDVLSELLNSPSTSKELQA